MFTNENISHCRRNNKNDETFSVHVYGYQGVHLVQFSPGEHYQALEPWWWPHDKSQGSPWLPYSGIIYPQANTFVTYLLRSHKSPKGKHIWAYSINGQRVQSWIFTDRMSYYPKAITYKIYNVHNKHQAVRMNYTSDLPLASPLYCFFPAGQK